MDAHGGQIGQLAEVAVVAFSLVAIEGELGNVATGI